MSITSARRAMLVGCLNVCVLAPGAAAHASARTDRLEAGIVRAMNDYRAQHGLPRLHTERGFARAADAHSAKMLRENRLAHGAVTQRLRRYVRAQQVGENLAWMDRCDPTEVVQMWAQSTGHRRVMLSRTFRRVGVAQRSRPDVCFVTADFGSAR
jgi:uncharacterized protein YkwD